MKKAAFLIIFSSWGLAAMAQVQIRPLPEEGFEKRIRDFVYNLWIVDTHEHLMAEENLDGSSMMDFMLLLHHYADDDIKSAGMGKPEFAELLTDKYTVAEKWQRVKPFWENAKSTAYGRAVLLAIDKLFGIPDLNDETVEKLSEKIREAYGKGSWDDYVLHERAMIRYAILDVGKRRLDDPNFRYVEKFDNFIRVYSHADIEKIAQNADLTIASLEDYEKALEKAFDEALARHIVGVKSALAYHRILDYQNTPRPVAEKVFNDLMAANSDDAFPFEEVKPLQDYIMHRIIRLAQKHDLPMQIHTGLQAGDGNIIRNSNPALLANLFLQYRDVKFILFHGGYPYGGEFGTLAKNFRHVYIDLCWLYIISPSYSERFLHEWIETVPANKIMAFGGDFHNVEGAYAHSLMAREVVANVLIEKVRTGYMTEAEAKAVAQKILYQNAKDLFGLE